MDKYTLVPLSETQRHDWKILIHLINSENKTMTLGIKGAYELQLTSLTDIRESKDLDKASQIDVEMRIGKDEVPHVVTANHKSVLLNKLTDIVSELGEGTPYHFGKTLYTTSYLQHLNVEHYRDEKFKDLIKLINETLPCVPFKVKVQSSICTHTRISFVEYICRNWNSLTEEEVAEVEIISTEVEQVTLEKSSENNCMKDTRETLINLGDLNREMSSVNTGVLQLFQQIKYFLKGVKPLSKEELTKINVRTTNIKREIGSLGETFDEDLFEFLATLEVQIGEDKLRNLNTSMRILIALGKGLSEVEVDEEYVLNTKDIILPKKFRPLTNEDIVHVYCAILSLTATKGEILTMEVPLEYLKKQLKEHIHVSEYQYAFIDGIIYYLNNKDNTSIPMLVGGWNSVKPFEICKEFILNAFERSTVLKNNNRHKVLFLFYILYNLLYRSDNDGIS